MIVDLGFTWTFGLVHENEKVSVRLYENEN